RARPGTRACRGIPGGERARLPPGSALTPRPTRWASRARGFAEPRAPLRIVAAVRDVRRRRSGAGTPDSRRLRRTLFFAVSVQQIAERFDFAFHLFSRIDELRHRPPEPEPSDDGEQRDNGKHGGPDDSVY